MPQVALYESHAKTPKSNSPRRIRIGAVRWSRFFGQVVKVDSRTEQEAPKWRGVQGADSAGGAARAGQRAGDRVAARASPEPSDHMEAAAARRAAGGVCRGCGPQGRSGARGEDPGRAGFFPARAQALSRAERVRMIERDGSLSLSRQCALLSVSQSSQYYRPKGESAEDLALMRRLNELHLAYPFYGSRQLMRPSAPRGRHRIRRLMAVMGMEATYRPPRTSVTSPEHRVFPYLLRGLTISRADHVWCADITYIPVTQGFFYLVAVMDWVTRHVLAWRLANVNVRSAGADDGDSCRYWGGSCGRTDGGVGGRTAYRLRVRCQCLASGRSQMAFFGLPYCLWRS